MAEYYSASRTSLALPWKWDDITVAQESRDSWIIIMADILASELYLGGI